MNYYQQGGSVQSPEEQVQQLVVAAMQGDQEAQQQIQQVAEAAKQGNERAVQIMQLIQQVAEQLQAQTQSARQGAKLNYMRRLKGECPEGMHMEYFKAGGKVCKKCMQDIERDKCGSKMKPKKGCGGMTAVMSKIKAHLRGGIMNDKQSAFGDSPKRANPRSTDHQGHKRPNHVNGTTKMKKTSRNVYSAFGDTYKYRPTNVGLVGHHATGNTGRWQSKQTVNDSTNKHTAFGGHVNKTHTGAKATSIGGLKKNGYSKGLYPKGGIGKMQKGGDVKKKNKLKIS